MADRTEGEAVQFPMAGAEELAEVRASRERLSTYLRRYIYINFQKEHMTFAVGAFSENGCLLDLYGREDVLRALADDGIRPGTLWSTLGANAVTSGLRYEEARTSIGPENAFGPLKKYALYYAPIQLLAAELPIHNASENSGLALLLPAKKADPVYGMLLAGMTHALMMTLQFNNVAIMGYEQSGMGILAVDTMMNPDTAIAYYSNPELFSILEIPPMDIYYKSLSRLIDPLPANREFWSIVTERRKVKGQSLTLKIGGKEIECIVTTDIYYQPSIRTSCIVFYVTTHAKIAQSISKRIGNNAMASFGTIIGSRDQALAVPLRKAEMFAQSDTSIMILGESGTGKDVFASAIHNAGRRRDKPFIALNCAALPRDLIASELFGYEGGAFTGAKRSGNIGKFELANGGTLFLDEVGELPLDLQALLLRAVEQKEFTRVGGSTVVKADVRIISATNANIMEEIQRRRFREDLFYRLGAARLQLPPLRERGDDVILLANYFIEKTESRMETPKHMVLTPEAEQVLRSYQWPGNVRELQNVISCIVQIYPGEQILPEYIRENLDYTSYRPAAFEETHTTRREEPTQEEVLQALAAARGNRTEAAKRLGVSRRTFYRMIQRLGIQLDP